MYDIGDKVFILESKEVGMIIECNKSRTGFMIKVLTKLGTYDNSKTDLSIEVLDLLIEQLKTPGDIQTYKHEDSTLIDVYRETVYRCVYSEIIPYSETVGLLYE